MRYRRAQADGATFFFTVVTYNRNKILCLDGNTELIKDAFAIVKRNHQFKIEAFVMLPDHIHCIWKLPNGDIDFSTRWMLIKSYFTRHCNNPYNSKQNESRINKREQYVWQRRFWEHQIRDDKDFKSHVDYIHYNPVKHKLAASPNDWPYSTFKRYLKAGIYNEDWGRNQDIEFDKSVGCE